MKPSILAVKPVKRAAYALAGGLAACFLLQCTEQPTEAAQGGGGSEAVALSGSFEYADHNPAALVRVRLRPNLFLSDTGSEATALGASGTEASKGVLRLE